jgi:hypothetical protein
MVVEEDVGIGEERGESPAIVLDAGIEDDGALGGIEVEEEGAALRVGSAPRKGPPAARLVARWGLDLDHVGAEIGEELAAVGNRDHAAELDDADAVEGVTRHRLVRRRTRPSSVG